MADLSSVERLIDIVKNDMSDHGDDVKLNYAIGYLKGFVSDYVPQDIINWHINHLETEQ